MGRTSYQQMSTYWPRSDDPCAAPINDIPKILFSKTLDDADATWPTPRVARGVLGRGEALFRQLPRSRHLHVLEAEPFPNGVVAHTYRPQHN